MKTVNDYYNDIRITSDPGLVSGPEEIRIIHAIRLKQKDETADMSFEEKAAYHQNKTNTIFASLGLPPPEYVNLSEQWKLNSKTAVLM